MKQHRDQLYEIQLKVKNTHTQKETVKGMVT